VNRLVEKKNNKYYETTVMTSGIGREHGIRMTGIFWFWWGCEEILRGLEMKLNTRFRCFDHC